MLPQAINTFSFRKSRTWPDCAVQAVRRADVGGIRPVGHEIRVGVDGGGCRVALQVQGGSSHVAVVAGLTIHRDGSMARRNGEMPEPILRALYRIIANALDDEDPDPAKYGDRWLADACSLVCERAFTDSDLFWCRGKLPAIGDIVEIDQRKMEVVSGTEFSTHGDPRGELTA